MFIHSFAIFLLKRKRQSIPRFLSRSVAAVKFMFYMFSWIIAQAKTLYLTPFLWVNHLLGFADSYFAALS